MFDYQQSARRIGMTESQLGRLCNLVRADYPNDNMMFELHVLRAILAVESGRASLAQVLKEPELQPPTGR